MKILIYNPLAAVWRPRLPAVLSIAQGLIDAGHDVVLVGCDKSVPACTANLDHAGAICDYCTARRDKGYALLSGRFNLKSIDEYLDADTRRKLDGTERIPDADALRALHYRGADVGYAAFSSYAYVARKPEPNLRNAAVARTIARLVRTGKLVYEAMTNAIAAEKPDRVILYHGRSDIDRAALRACQHGGVECWVYENALSLNQLVYFKNALPQDVDNFARTVDELWAQAPADKHTIAESFYTMRRQGQSDVQAAGATIATQDRSYITRQTRGTLPDDWDGTRKNIVFYGTSNDEFIAIGPDYEDRLYPTQVDALARISASLQDDPSVHLYFRIHPRQARVRDELSDGLMRLDRERNNVTVIPADSDVSSYTLLDNADLVLTFRSTMSMQAVYWGKPCLILSASIFRPLGATYNPTTHEEVIELIRALPPPKDKTPALKVGYYYMRSGSSHDYFTADIGKGRKGYTFRGDAIMVTGLKRWRYVMSRERQRLKWRKLL
ncbi:MAG TPA: hypothetical protein VIM81_10870 [Gammaproteobacteria bacterium]|jgi:hypothetical protein